MGSDHCQELPDRTASHFNSRSPCGERPAVRADNPCCCPISTHAPRVGSDAGHRAGASRGGISTHAPRVGSDCQALTISLTSLKFQLTLPVWGATRRHVADQRAARRISTHAPRVGSDPSQPSALRGRSYFNSRSPCGERLVVSSISSQQKKFQLTLPVWGATCPGACTMLGCHISTHAPRVGSDLTSVMSTAASTYFNSRSPCGERRNVFRQCDGRGDFNSRSPCGERPRPA